jgi:ketosteroid isomerase-like protein
MAGGGEQAMRMTTVLVREDGQWRVVQSHASIGVPNADIFG